MNEDIKKFWKTAMIFIVVSTISFLVINHLYETKIIPEFKISKGEKQFQESISQNTKVYILGDSHAESGLNPAYINGSFNYAIGGENIRQTFYRFRYMINKNISFSTIILPVDPHIFSNYRTNAYSEIWFWSKKLTMNELQFETDNSKYEIILKNTFPVLGNGLDFIRIRSLPTTQKIKGWKKRGGDFNKHSNQLIKARARVQSQFGYGNNNNEYLKESFEYLLRMACNNKKEVFLVKFPLSQPYLLALNEINFDKEQLYKEVNTITDKYFCVKGTLDYQEHFKNNLTLFSNSDHLNAVGAKIFSKKINDDMNSIRGLPKATYED